MDSTSRAVFTDNYVVCCCKAVEQIWSTNLLQDGVGNVRGYKQMFCNNTGYGKRAKPYIIRSIDDYLAW